ncbi:hypothetical protein IJJ39_01885 [Candidatus Saccharibacteria bacterium]|nr:hypothetical protein [Candidatus Saccharibacteria bacterium]
MKAIQKIKQKLKSLSARATNQVAVKEDTCGGIASKALLGHGVASARRHGRGAPSTSVVTSGESSKCLADDSYNISSINLNNIVLRHGLFLSLYSLIKKASGKLPWRSRTNHNSNSSSTSTSTSSSTSYSRSSVSTSARGLNTTRNYIKNFRRIRILGSASLFSFGLLLLATFVPLYNVARTEDTEATAGTAQDSSITFTSTRSTASVDLTVTSENGTFASSTDGTNGTTDTRAAFSLSTTNFTGYTLTIASNTNTSTLTNTNGGSLSSISSPIDESTFNTTTYNNMWGYKPNYYGSSANSNFLPSPTTTASTLDETSSANSTAKSYTIALGARADYTNASGTYSSSNYKLMYVANPVAHSITFADNSGDSTVANIPAVQSSDSVTTTTIVLTSATPTRTGYSFKSWCLGIVSSNGTVCTGTEYASGASFGIDRTANKASNTATLTAVWTANKYTCTKQYRLQNADGSWGGYTTDTTEQVAYNSTCSYSKTVTNYKGSENGTNGSAATNSATMNSTNGITVQVSLYRNTFACSKRYRLQNADGNYPSSYTSVTGETIRYGATCSYSQSYTNYQTESTSATITAATTLSLDLPRNTYALTINRNTTYISSVSGAGTYRWGQSISISATAASNSEFTSWSVSSGSTGSFGNASSASTTYTMPKGASTIYANGKTSKIYMQDLTESSITSILPSTGSTYTVYDKRDDKSYTIAKLADGNYWMTQNLNIAGGTTLTSTLSNVSSNYTLPTSSTSGISQNYDTAYVYNDSTYGGYYSWTAVTAGKTGDICPKNWRLPRLAEYDTLVTKYSTASAITSSPANFLYASGNYNEGAKVNAGTRAIYWTSVGSTNTGAGVLRVWGSDAPSTHSDFQNRIAGSVRCVLKTSSNKLYMQNMTSSDCTTAAITVYDNRDQEAYLVQKLPDGKCWMLDNLRLGSTSTIPLTTANSNTNGNWTLPASITSGFNSDNVAQINVDSKDIVASTKYGNGSGKIGVYYNYCAASAGTICVSGYNNYSSASYDICPKGWRMPTGGSSGEYKALATACSSNPPYLRAALSTPHSGYFKDSSALAQGSSGLFWSSTNSYPNSMYTIYVNSSGADLASYDGRELGLSVRCVLK